MAYNYSVTSASKCLMSSFSAAVNFVPVSETILTGCPLRAKNRLEVLMKASADWFWHISRCTARVLMQVFITR